MAQVCPHCARWCVKDDRCNYVVCGRDGTGFRVGMGCGRPFCFQCGKKLCGQMFCPATGRLLDANEDHDNCAGCDGRDDHCPGGHNSHRAARPRATGCP